MFLSIVIERIFKYFDYVDDSSHIFPQTIIKKVDEIYLRQYS